AKIHSHGGWGPRRVSPLRACGQSSEFPPALDTILAGRIDDRDQPYDAAVAAFPVPRKIGEGAAFSGDLVDIAADILNSENAVVEQDAVDRLPFRKIVFPVAPAGPFPIFLGQVRMQWAIALGADCRCERMVIRLRVVADHLDLLFDEPFAGRRHEARRAAEIVLAVLVEFMPAGVDDDHVTWPHDLAAGLFEIVAGDGLPLIFWNRDDNARTEEMRQRYLVDERRALNDVRRRV